MNEEEQKQLKSVTRNRDLYRLLYSGLLLGCAVYTFYRNFWAGGLTESQASHDEILLRYDQNNDGSLDRSELVKMVREQGYWRKENGKK